MSILADSQINGRLAAKPPLATDVTREDYHRADSAIQAASLDLTIGGIYVPDTDDGKPGSVSSPLSELSLAQGHTAVVKTKETLNMAPDLAGIAFPPSSLSLKGLLTTNPGHIDPGYVGPLHLTVINMGRVPFQLKNGDRIIRVLFITLDKVSDFPYNLRHPGEQPSPLTSELLQRLSVDFLDFEKRAQDTADAAVRKAQFWATTIPIVIAALTIAATILGSNLSVKGDIQKISDRVTVAEDKIAQQPLGDRVTKLEDAVSRLTTAK